MKRWDDHHLREAASFQDPRAGDGHGPGDDHVGQQRKVRSMGLDGSDGKEGERILPHLLNLDERHLRQIFH